MAQQIEDIKVLNIDGVPYAVDSMSEEVKKMVDVYNGWNVKEADARDALMIIQAARNELSRQIILQVRKEKGEAEAAEQAAANEGNTEAPAETEETTAE